MLLLSFPESDIVVAWSGYDGVRGHVTVFLVFSVWDSGWPAHGAMLQRHCAHHLHGNKPGMRYIQHTLFTARTSKLAR